MSGAPADTHASARAPARRRASLRWRLVGVFVLFSMAATGVLLGGMRGIVHASWRGYGRPLVAGTVDLMVREIGTPPDPARAADLARRMPVVIRIDDARGRSWTSPNTPAHIAHFGLRAGADPDAPYMVERRLADGSRIFFGLAAEPAPPHTDRIGWLTLAVVLALTAGAYAYVRWLFLPLQDIREGAARFGRGEFGHRIPARRDDELGDLAGRINTMGAEIGAMLDAQRALLVALSHELRSPITRARVNAELLSPGAARDALVRDLGQMRDLVEDLLESERLSTGRAALLREPVAMADLVRETLERHFPEREVRVHVAPGLPPVEVDRLRVRLLLRNLLDNALRHGAADPPPEIDLDLLPAPGGPPPVAGQAGPAVLRLAVRDHGPGAPADVLARLGEPFYRPDPARRRATGGVGLGLTLCRLVVDAHGGRWRVEDAAPGLRVVVELPARASPAPGIAPAVPR